MEVGEIWEKEGELYKRRHRPRELSDVATLTTEGGNGCEYGGEVNLARANH